MAKANYVVIVSKPDVLVIEDVGPWDRYQTITNAAEEVVAELKPTLLGRRLFYIDSEGDKTELLIDSEGRFTGFGRAD